MTPCASCGGWNGRHDPTVHDENRDSEGPDVGPWTCGECPTRCADCPLPRQEPNP